MPISKPEAKAQHTSRRSSPSWTLDLEREEEKGTLNARLPKSLIDDIKLLSSHYDSTDQVVIERCLKFALGSNRELQQLKANAQLREGGEA